MKDKWPEIDKERLESFVKSGVRICDIVDRFGGKYRRGAIVGKIRRLKLVKVSKGGGPRAPRGRILKLSDKGKKGVSIYLNRGCSRILCDEHDNFLKNNDGHILCCGDPIESGPYCPHCTSLLNNPKYGANAIYERKTSVAWKHWTSRRGGKPRMLNGSY